MDAFVTIPSGWFLMGSTAGGDEEQPAHRVFVDAFALAVHPVTRDDYARFLDDTGHTPPREWSTQPAGRGLPVVGVSWEDAQAYCAWRSTTDRALRLPTEAEWERAARGGAAGAAYPWGDEIPAWVPAAGRGPLDGPWPVSLGDPNPYGLFGIGANVHEWCADWFAADFYGRSPSHNPRGPETGVRRASRGGSWRHAITISRCAARSRLDPTFRYTDYGFRVAHDL